MNLYASGVENAVYMLFLSLRRMSTLEFEISHSKRALHSSGEIMKTVLSTLRQRLSVECLHVCMVKESLLMESLSSCANFWSMIVMERRVVVFTIYVHMSVVSLDWILKILQSVVWISNFIKVSGFCSDIF